MKPGQPVTGWPPAKWNWVKVFELHRTGSQPPCGGQIYSHTYRYHSLDSPSYERCISLTWCTACRDYTGTMVYVPRAHTLSNPIASLDPEAQKRLRASEVRLIGYLDRLVRRGDSGSVELLEVR